MSFIQPTKLQEVLYEVAPLPQPVLFFIRSLSHVHWFWRLNRKKQLYENPDNWLSLIAGHVTGALISESSYIRSLAHVLFVAKRVQDYIVEAAHFREELVRFKEAINGYWIPVNPAEWWVPTGMTYSTSASSEVERNNKWHRIGYRTYEIYRTGLAALKSLFSLTMCTIEVYDSFYRRSEALNECFVNIMGWAEDLSKNKVNIQKGIRSSSRVVNVILKKWNIDVDADRLAAPLEKILYGVEKVSNVYKEIAPILVIESKRFIAGVLHIYFLKRFTPSGWSPNYGPPKFEIT